MIDKDKLYALFTAAFVTFGVAVLFFIMIMMIIGIQDESSERYNEICVDLDMEYLSRTNQVFGDDYVVCVDKMDKNIIKEIPV